MDREVSLRGALVDKVLESSVAWRGRPETANARAEDTEADLAQMARKISQAVSNAHRLAGELEIIKARHAKELERRRAENEEQLRVLPGTLRAKLVKFCAGKG